MNKASYSFIRLMMATILITLVISCKKDDKQEKEEVIEVPKDTRELPNVTWNNYTKDLVVGLELSSSYYRTNAAYLSGKMEYFPPVGTMLPVGTDQEIKIKFTPSDTLHYKTYTEVRKINVIPLPVVTDIDGNVYHSVVIGYQVWMVENLKTTHFRDGTAIANGITNKQWMTSSPVWCNYDNDEANGLKYGRIYNDVAMMSKHLIAPAGWHVPTSSDWSGLAGYLVSKGHNYDHSVTGYQRLAKALSATTDWQPSTVDGSPGNDLTKNNSSGFTALPGGERGSEGDFSGLGRYCAWHTAENYPARELNINYDALQSYVINAGMYIRLIKDN